MGHLMKSPLTVPLLMSCLFFSALIMTAMIQSSDIHGKSSQNKRLKHKPKNEREMSLAEKSGLGIVMSNKYIERDGMLGEDYPWAKDLLIAEPYLPTTFTVEGHDPNHEYRWELRDENDDYISLSGPTIKLQFRHLHRYTLVLKEYTRGTADLLGTVPRQKVEILLAVKYVRREVRNLMDEDVQAIFDAMAVMWEVDDISGKETYGRKYISMETLLKVHLRLTGASECDHIQDGAGFLSHYTAFTYAFEQSLQAINPRASLPYWDYINDIEDWAENGFEDFKNGPLFNEKYFGATDQTTGYIKDGRWANLEVPKVSSLAEEELSIPHNIYGFLRSPWSNNDDSHLIRSSKTCGVIPVTNTIDRCHFMKTVSNQDTWQSFARFLSHDPYQRVRLLLGGTWNCEESFNALAGLVDQRILDNIKTYSFKIQKNLFRLGQIECSIEMPSCSCPEYDSYLLNEEAAEEFLSSLAIEELGGKFYKRYDWDTKRAIISAVCNSQMIVGDQLQSSSTFAPEFWTMHPAIERMFMWKQISKPLSNTDWPTDSLWVEESNEVCYGHMPDDEVLSGLVHLHMEGAFKLPTVQQMIEFLDPTKDHLPYIYDNFQYDYCSI